MKMENHLIYRYIITGTAAFILSFGIAEHANANPRQDAQEVAAPAFAKIANGDLTLNGSGRRRKLFVDLYVAALYLPERQRDANAILASKERRRLSITAVRELSSEDVARAFIQGMQQSVDKAERARIVPQLQRLGEVLSQQRSLVRGDVMTIDWQPEIGTTIAINGKPIAPAFPDIVFYNNILKIFIGDNPIDEDLKKSLLSTAP